MPSGGNTKGDCSFEKGNDDTLRQARTKCSSKSEWKRPTSHRSVEFHDDSRTDDCNYRLGLANLFCVVTSLKVDEVVTIMLIPHSGLSSCLGSA